MIVTLRSAPASLPYLRSVFHPSLNPSTVSSEPGQVLEEGNMEFVKELFATASLALILSFLIAKLVSLVMSGDALPDSGLGTRGDVMARAITEEANILDGADKSHGESVGVETRGDGGCEPVRDGCRAGVVEGLKQESGVHGPSEELLEVAENALEFGDFHDEERNCGLDCSVATDKEKDPAADKIAAPFFDDVSPIHQGEDAEAERRGKDQDSGGEDDEDWEGIERSDLEKVFDAAAKIVRGEGRDELLANVSGDVQQQLCVLHVIATEGHCYEPQPMALKLSDRAKWNVWQKLGHISPEEAMEQYVGLLADNLPVWMDKLSEVVSTGAPKPNLTTHLQHQPHSTSEGELVLAHSIQGGNMAGSLNPVKKVE